MRRRYQRVKTQSIAGLLLVAAALVSPTTAFAHKLNIFAFAENGKVSIEGFFVDGKKVQNGELTVIGPDGKVLVKGKTDQNGAFSFPVTSAVDLRISLDAGMGHRAEIVLPASELGPVAIHDEAVAAAPKAASPSPLGNGPAVSAGVDPAALQQVVDKAVAEAIKPLVRSLEESQQHASITQIIGSVGYIFGVLGLWAWFKGRQEGAKGKTSSDR